MKPRTAVVTIAVNTRTFVRACGGFTCADTNLLKRPLVRSHASSAGNRERAKNAAAYVEVVAWSTAVHLRMSECSPIFT
jgi:hypothetical protein